MQLQHVPDNLTEQQPKFVAGGAKYIAVLEPGQKPFGEPELFTEPQPKPFSEFFADDEPVAQPQPLAVGLADQTPDESKSDARSDTVAFELPSASADDHDPNLRRALPYYNSDSIADR